MLTSWLTFTSLVAASASPQRAASSQFPLTVAPTCRVIISPEQEFILNCGDGKNTGVVQYWHTPFGDFKFPGSHNELDPVSMNQDGSLVISNSSSLHHGLYYCLLQSRHGASLWPYELHSSYDHEDDQDVNGDQRSSSCHQLRVRRNAEPEGKDEEAGVSEEQLAGAVAASVLLTFVVGFSAGALARKHVLRCLQALIAKKRSLQRQRQPDKTDVGCEISITTLPSMYDNEGFEMRQSVDDLAMNTTVSSTSSSPPQKPKRSFRHKREEEQETTTYLERCDRKTEKERKTEEQEGQKEEDVKENQTEPKACDVDKEKEVRKFYTSGEGAGSETETDQEIYSRDGEEDDGEDREETGAMGEEEGERYLEKNGKGREMHEEEESEVSSLSDDVESDAEPEEKRYVEDEERKEEMLGQKAEQADEQEEGGSREKETDVETEDEEQELDEGEKRSDEEHSQNSSSDSDDEETVPEVPEDTKDEVREGEKEASSSPPRRSRVIRLYQYDEDGQRYCHLPETSPKEPAPVLTQKQRSVSLTRLNAIMAAASAGPLDRRETGGEEKEERPHFKMDI